MPINAESPQMRHPDSRMLRLTETRLIEGHRSARAGVANTQTPCTAGIEGDKTMRKILLSTALILLAVGAAQADTAIGRIVQILHGEQTVILSDGRNFDFSERSSDDDWNRLAGFLPGDSVHITYHRVGDRLVADAIGSTSVFHAVGRITEIAPDRSHVTLDTGQMFRAEMTSGTDEANVQDALGGFRVGDQVRIAFRHSNAGLVAVAIGGTASMSVTGVVREISGDTVTLDNGEVYRFHGMSDDTSSGAAGFRPGNRVTLLLHPQTGDHNTYEMIIPARD